MAALWDSLVFFLVSALLHQLSEAVSQIDVDRVVLAYNGESDNCKEITDSSVNVSKAAADDACEEAFFALDRVGLNTCHGWRNAGCRLISGQKYRQCSCLVSACDDTAIRHIPKPFRECATNILTKQRHPGVEPTPSKNFEQRRIKYNDALQVALTRRASIYSDHYGRAGKYFGYHSSGGAGSSGCVPIAGDAGSSSGVQTAGGTAPRRPGRPAGPARIDAGNPRHFPCTVCPKSYLNQRSLRAHMKSHSTDETKCTVCPQRFTLKQNLRTHMRKYHPEEPLPPKAVRVRSVMTECGSFTCAQCGKTYRRRKILRNHERSHDTLETHCFKCKYTLSSRASYKTHLRRTHPQDALAEKEAENVRYFEENPEACGICTKRFKNLDGLRAHRKTHEGKTTCDVCGAIFSRVTYRNFHKAKVHPKTRDFQQGHH